MLIYDLKYINDRIKKEICYKTINKLSDKELLSYYIESKSVKKTSLKLETILNKYIIDKNITKDIMNEYFADLIPPGVKAVYRGNEFNKIIKNYIDNLNLDNKRFNICYENKCPHFKTDEIPDWYIFDTLTNKTIIGMNQLDIWSGGHQINRGAKYLYINNDKQTKLLCVISNDIILKSEKNKVFNLFKVGFMNDTLCYLNNLEYIIKSYYGL